MTNHRTSPNSTPGRLPAGIRVRRLRVSYDDHVILKGIDLDIPPGKVTAIIGPSGCGKTTLLRCFNRLAETVKNCKVEGHILLDGQDIHSMDPMLLRRRVGMVFQRPNPFPMSVQENVLYGIKASRLKVNQKETVESSLRRAALWDEVRDRLHVSAHRLSVGQQQRLCIARALAVSPEVILMDEPASALDPASTTRIESCIQELRGEYTVVIVTHNMQQARRISDYVAFLYLGELVEWGETCQVFEHPKRRETQRYISGQFG